MDKLEKPLSLKHLDASAQNALWVQRKLASPLVAIRPALSHSQLAPLQILFPPLKQDDTDANIAGSLVFRLHTQLHCYLFI